MTKDAHHYALQPGYSLLWYSIERVLGRGAFGITYLAHDINLDRLVAIKEYMPGHLAVRTPEFTVHPLSTGLQEDFQFGLSRFISEARTLTKFEHPNLIRVYNAFEANNTAYMVMNYEVGESLQAELKRKKTLSEDELLKIMLPLMDGLQNMHAQNFIHRDIKPGNIFIRKADGSPVLIDFGSARQTRLASAQTLTNFVSPGYAPIEQYTSNSDKQGPWTDIYGLGATVYKIITGTAPMNAVDRGEAIMHDGKDCYIPLAREGLRGFTPAFLVAIDHALAFKAADRPLSINDWKKELPASSEQITAEAVTSAAEGRLVISLEQETTEINKGGGDETFPLTLEQTFDPSKKRREDQTASEKPDSFLRFFTDKKKIYLTVFAIIVVAIAGGVIFMGNEEETEAITLENSSTAVTVNEITVPAQLVAEESPQAAEPVGAQTEQILQLLALAETSVRELRLTSPASNNAYEQYRQVLALDPENEQASTGLRSISDKYVALAYGALKTDNTDKAGVYIRKARDIWPDSDKIQAAQKALEARLEEIAKQKESEIVEVVEPVVAEQPAGNQTEESTGMMGGMKKWFKDNAEKNKDATKKEGTGDQFIKSIGGGK